MIRIEVSCPSAQNNDNLLWLNLYFVNSERPSLNIIFSKKNKSEKFVPYQETSDTKSSEMALNDLSDERVPASSNLFFMSL